MVKVLRGLLLVFFVLFGGIALFGLFLPSEGRVERAITIDHSAERVFAELNGPKAFNAWSPWFQIDPKTIIEYSGPETGLGAKARWRSENPQVGAGTMEVVAYDAPRSVTYLMTFEGIGQGYAKFDLYSTGGDTSALTWSYEAELDSISLKYFGLVMDDVIGKMYEEGLTKLQGRLAL